MNIIKKLDKAKRSAIVSVAFALVLVLVGVLFCAYPDDSVRIVCYVLGGLLIAGGVAALAAFFLGGMRTEGNRLVIGAALLCVGILFLVRRTLIAQVFSLLCGILLIVDGLFKLQQAIYCTRRKRQIWIAYLVLAIVYLIYGIVVLASSRALAVLIGVGLIVEGVCDLVFFLIHTATVRKTESASPALPERGSGTGEGKNGAE